MKKKVRIFLSIVWARNAPSCMKFDVSQEPAAGFCLVLDESSLCPHIVLFYVR